LLTQYPFTYIFDDATFSSYSNNLDGSPATFSPGPAHWANDGLSNYDSDQGDSVTFSGSGLTFISTEGQSQDVLYLVFTDLLQLGTPTLGFSGSEIFKRLTTTLPQPFYGGVLGTNGGLSTVVSSTAVPVPAAVWLFGSGLLGLVGVAKRKVS